MCDLLSGQVSVGGEGLKLDEEGTLILKLSTWGASDSEHLTALPVVQNTSLLSELSGMVDESTLCLFIYLLLYLTLETKAENWDRLFTV